jgi:hypothetical protein
MKTTNRLTVLAVTVTFFAAIDVHAYFNPQIGKWASRDPIDERGGPNLYAFNRNDAVNRIDPFGQFSVGDHATLTTLSFWEAIYVLGSQSGTPCQQKMLHTLVRANEMQDWVHSFSLRRHYNRSIWDDSEGAKLAADQDYEQYLVREKIRFTLSLAPTPSSSGCWRALRALGRMSHSWQDFYAHAIRRDGQGGIEPGSPSSAEGWLAWSKGVTGSPEPTASRVNFWPSSYSMLGGGEHPPFSEPVVWGGAEYLARRDGAEVFVEHQFVDYLGRWLETCKCYCP